MQQNFYMSIKSSTAQQPLPGSSPDSLSDSADRRARAIVFDAPGKLSLQWFQTPELEAGDLLIDVHASGISTGTERLLWDGDMPDFPGMGYPLIPGYEAVGEVTAVGLDCTLSIGDFVFVGGSRCFSSMRSLFGGAASRLVVPEEKVVPINAALGSTGLLLALAATAHHALHAGGSGAPFPDLIIGHGVLGRLMARLIIALEQPVPTVWEISEARQGSNLDYPVVHPQHDENVNYQHIIDVSGDSDILDRAIKHLAKKQPASLPPQITLAGFYKDALSFQFAAAFMKEVRIQIAAEWLPEDMQAVSGLVNSGVLSLDGLITHTASADEAVQAYATAFRDHTCLKMALDWRN